jgi:signal transduction histidine kinase
MVTGIWPSLARRLEDGLSPRHARALDRLPAVLVLAIGIPGALHDQHSMLVTVPLATALALVLVARTRYPVGTFVALSALAFGQWLLDIKLDADVALLVGLYSVASRRSLRATLAAGLVLEIGIGLAAHRWSGFHPGAFAFVLLSGMAVAAGVLGIYARTRAAYLAQLHQRAERLERDRDQRAQLAVAAERARIAREMHDIIAHHLTVVIALSEGAAAAVSDTPDAARDAMHLVSATGREALTDTRQLLGVLRTDADTDGGERAPQPGPASLDSLLDQVRAAGLPTVLTVRGQDRALPGVLRLAVYRLVQESLTNTLKHAGPDSHAQVTLDYQPDLVMIEVQDDGQGTRPAPGSGSEPAFGSNANDELPGGHGIAGMRERVAAWGGELSCGPLRPRGWRVTARLPRDAAAGSHPVTVAGPSLAGAPLAGAP